MKLLALTALFCRWPCPRSRSTARSKSTTPPPSSGATASTTPTAPADHPGLRRRLDLASRSHARASRNGPDIIHLGDRYCLYVAANIGAQPRAAHQHDLEPDASTRIRPTTNGRRPAWSLRRTASKTATPSIPGVFLDPEREAVAGLRLLFRLHPAGRTRSANRPARSTRTTSP